MNTRDTTIMAFIVQSNPYFSFYGHDCLDNAHMT